MNVLVPMDFTEVSLNGLEYAFHKFEKASLTIVHVISGILDVKGPFMTKANVTQDLMAVQGLEETICQHFDWTELPSNIRIEAYYGEAVIVISKYLQDHTFDAVVIGSRDKYDLLDKIFGTISLGVVKRTSEPIFVIPRYAKFKKNEKILVASDTSVGDPEILMAINYWNNHNAQVKFLHISTEEDESYEQTKEQLIKNLYEEYQPPFSYEIEEVKAKNVTDSLLANAYNYGADLMIVIARPSSFLKNLVYRSTSQDLIQKSSIPLLFLHHKSDSVK